MSETTWCGFASATGPKAKLICGKNCTGRFSSRCGIGSSFGRLRFIPSGTPSCGRMEPTSRRSFSTPRWPHGYPAAPADRDPGAAPVGMQGRVLAAAAERRLDTEPKRGASTRGERAGNGREIAKHPTPFAPSRLRLPRDRIEGRSGLATPPAAGSCSSVTAATDSVSPLAGLAPLHPSEGRTRRALVLPSRSYLRAFGAGNGPRLRVTAACASAPSTLANRSAGIACRGLSGWPWRRYRIALCLH